MEIIGQEAEPLKRLIPVKILKRIAQIHLDTEKTIEQVSEDDLYWWIQQRLGDQEITWSEEKLDLAFEKIYMDVKIPDALDRVDGYITLVNDLDSIHGVRRYFKQSKVLRKAWRKRLLKGVFPKLLRAFVKGELEKLGEAESLSEHCFWQKLKTATKICDYFTGKKVVTEFVTHKENHPGKSNGKKPDRRGSRTNNKKNGKKPERCWIKGCRAVHLIKDHPGASSEQIKEALERRQAHLSRQAKKSKRAV